MTLTYNEIQMMNVIGQSFPKNSSIKQCLDAMKLERSKIVKAAEGLKALGFIHLSPKNEIILRKPGKEHLGLHQSNDAAPKTNSIRTEQQKPAPSLAHKTIVENEQKIKASTQELDNSEMLKELAMLEQRLAAKLPTIDSKDEKVTLLTYLSEKLTSKAPYISKKLKDIANDLTALETAA